MYFSGDIQPAFGGYFVVANDTAGALRKDLCSTARAAVHSSLLEGLNGLFDCELGSARKKIQLYHRKRFQMHLGKSLLEAAQQVNEIGECQVRVESSYDVKFRNGLRVTERGMVISFIQRHRIAIFARFSREAAELAVHDAHV